MGKAMLLYQLAGCKQRVLNYLLPIKFAMFTFFYAWDCSPVLCLSQWAKLDLNKKKAGAMQSIAIHGDDSLHIWS